MQIYVQSNGEQQGPFTVDQLKGYLAMGQFQHTDLAWREGMADWKPLGEFPEFPAKAHRTPNYRGVPIRTIAQKKKSGRGKGILSTVAVVVVLAAAGGGGYYFWRQYQAKHSGPNGGPAAPTDSEFASGKPGIPKTLDELNHWYEEPPAGQNAAEYFQKGFEALQMTDADQSSKSLPLFGKAPLPAPAYPVPAAMKTALKAFVDQNQSALDQFARAAQCSGSRYPVDLAQGNGVNVSHLAHVRQAARLGLLSALFQSDSRNGTNAARDILSTLASASSLQSEPIVLSQLVRIANEGLATEALEQTFNRAAVPVESLNSLQAAFNHATEDEATGLALNRALVNERVSGLAALDHPSEESRQLLATLTESPATNSPAAGAENLFTSPKEQHQFFEDSLNQALAARKDPLPGRLHTDDLVLARADEAKAKGYLYCALVLPALGKTAAREAGALAHLNLARTAIALERFRGDHTNRYPASLTELAPKYLGAVPADPFDGQPLRYQKGTQGYLLHSIGADLKDDGGVRKPGSDDLLFSVARPPRAS